METTIVYLSISDELIFPLLDKLISFIKREIMLVPEYIH